MKRSSVLILCCLFLMMLTAGCSRAASDGTMKLYYKNADGTELSESGYTPKAADGQELADELLAKLQDKPEDTAVSAVFPEGVAISGTTFKDGKLTVDFGKSYQDMDAVSEILLRAAVVQTATQVTEVKEVAFTIEGKALMDAKDKEVGTMKASSFIHYNGDGINSYLYAPLTLYFANSSGKLLNKESRNVHYSSAQTLASIVMEQLIAGPSNGGNLAVIPKDTKVLGVTVEKNLCTVNLNSQFNQAIADAATKPEVTVYAIVNAICDTCADITSVQLQVEGSSDIQLRSSVDLSKPFERDMNMIYQQDSESDTEAGASTPVIGVDPTLKETQ